MQLSGQAMLSKKRALSLIFRTIRSNEMNEPQRRTIQDKVCQLETVEVRLQGEGIGVLCGEVRIVGQIQGQNSKERSLSHLFCKHFCYSMAKGMLSLKSLYEILKPDSLRIPCMDGKLQYHSVKTLKTEVLPDAITMVCLTIYL